MYHEFTVVVLGQEIMVDTLTLRGCPGPRWDPEAWLQMGTLKPTPMFEPRQSASSMHQDPSQIHTILDEPRDRRRVSQEVGPGDSPDGLDGGTHGGEGQLGPPCSVDPFPVDQTVAWEGCRSESLAQQGRRRRQT